MAEIKQLIIHDPCGLPIEFCECPDAELKYDWDTDTFRIIKGGVDMSKLRFPDKPPSTGQGDSGRPGE